MLLLLASNISLQALADTESCVTEGTCATDTVREENKFDYFDEDDYDDEDDDDDDDDTCVDTHSDCGSWAEGGECTSNSEFMRKECEKSCGLCDEAEDGDDFEE